MYLELKIRYRMKLIITITIYIHGYVPQNPRLLIRNTVPLVDSLLRDCLKNLLKIFLSFKLPLKGKKENYT